MKLSQLSSKPVIIRTQTPGHKCHGVDTWCLESSLLRKLSPLKVERGSGCGPGSPQGGPQNSVDTLAVSGRCDRLI